jgi:hypothetical protein
MLKYLLCFAGIALLWFFWYIESRTPEELEKMGVQID